MDAQELLRGEAPLRSVAEVADPCDLGPEARALSLPGGDQFVPKEGKQQPCNAHYEPERAGAVSGLSERPDAEGNVGGGKEEATDAELARSHASDGTSDPRRLANLLPPGRAIRLASGAQSGATNGATRPTDSSRSQPISISRNWLET